MRLSSQKCLEKRMDIAHSILVSIFFDAKAQGTRSQSDCLSRTLRLGVESRCACSGLVIERPYLVE
jgi:hypothetical protein